MDRHALAFSALSDESRLRIIHLLLASNQELCCCELTDALEIPQYNISKHLAALSKAGLIRERRDGKWIYYSIAPSEDSFRAKLLETVASIRNHHAFRRDERELTRRLSYRQGGRCVQGTLKRHLLSGSASGRSIAASLPPDRGGPGPDLPRRGLA